MTILYLVIPCYNEEEVLPETTRRLGEKFDSLLQSQMISPESRILLVDDGSRDHTWPIIEALHRQDPRFGGVKLSRNKGHQNALLAGLTVANGHCDAVISLDADLQDDINAIDRMVERFQEGYEVVYGVRSSRATDTAFKRGTAGAFYKLMRMLGVEIVDNHADYRLLSKRALAALLEFQEVNLFLRGIVPLIGFRSTVVPYERAERFAGESKYPLKKMLLFAFDGITSFSIRPIRLVTLLGALIFGGSLLGLFALLIQKLFGQTVQGWTTLMGSIWMLGGIQLLCLGIIGEYIGRIYQETKHRPRFIIDQIRLDETNG
ncbi:MAG: glycosyltransferase [Oscillospiraceae bacterium]|nr:MAG: glycosyltransferase [Oscillospiraceae bacterium]